MNADTCFPFLRRGALLRWCCLLLLPAWVQAAKPDQPVKALQIKDRQLTYTFSERGDRVLDYSCCGYRASDEPLPVVAPVWHFACREGDNSAAIQEALDRLAALPPDARGFRGALLLGEGRFELHHPLRISASGVVLRGMGPEKSVLVKMGVDRGPCVRIEGAADRKEGGAVALTSAYVPLNGLEMEAAGHRLQAGDRLLIRRASTAEWIESLGCTVFGGDISALGWKAGDIDLCWDREVVAVDGDRFTIDAPLSMALDPAEGAVTVAPYVWPGRICGSGVEYLAIESDFDRTMPTDEDHCWTGISIDRARDCWVRRVDFRHLAGSAVVMQPESSRITVEDCISRAPVSELGGMRRMTFLTYGQQNLVQRCYSEEGINDFAAGFCAAGPNAFVQCDTYDSKGVSGSVDSWACGLLFDGVNIDGSDLFLGYYGMLKNGAGWSTGNSFCWQCTASAIVCAKPSDATTNRAYGCWAQFEGDGEWSEANNHIHPRSLFYAQLAERIGADRVPDSQSRVLPRNTSATSSPTVDEAMRLAREAFEPRLTLERWIEEAPREEALFADAPIWKTPAWKEAVQRRREFSVRNGQLLADGEVIAGGRYECPWWNGKLRTNYLAKARPAVGRFVPGREGLGLTDCLDSVVAYMQRNRIAAYDHNYGLWYDRRRDDHERVRRRDGDVWGPFYEQPFARSGEGRAWDGLSRYDLTKPNRWYYWRLREFADRAAREGLLLYNEHFFQHNILEAGAHWVDSPWRTVNNINATDFPEPVPFAGDKRIFMAEHFYDVGHPVRRALYRGYIRQQLEAFADCPNVVHYLSHEYTGPLAFVQFWLDVIAEWEAETGRQVLVALAATKDVQDAVLADPVRSRTVDIIDIRYWHYKTDGLYAPEGGKNLAPRQHARKMKVGKVTFDEAYRAVAEYRSQYPDKAVTYYAQNYPDQAWAVFFAGGSCASLPVSDPAFLRDAATRHSVTDGTAGCLISLTEAGAICCGRSTGAAPTVTLPAGTYAVDQIDPKSGLLQRARMRLKGGREPLTLDFVEPHEICWIHRIGRKR